MATAAIGITSRRNLSQVSMSHTEFPANVTQQTISAYFWAGVVTGVLPFQGSHDWAFSVIEASDSPPIEIIEIATANDRNSAIDALRALSHGADLQKAGGLLFADIHAQLHGEHVSPMEAIHAATRVTRTTGLVSA